MFHGLLEDQKNNIKAGKLVVAALYEAKVNENEILHLLKKYCNIDDIDAINLFQNEKYINSPCRRLEQYLLIEKGYDYNKAILFINKYAIKVLANNTSLSESSPSKLYDIVKKYEGNQKKLNELSD